MIWVHVLKTKYLCWFDYQKFGLTAELGGHRFTPCPRHVYPKSSCSCHVHDRGVDMDTVVHLVRDLVHLTSGSNTDFYIRIQSVGWDSRIRYRWIWQIWNLQIFWPNFWIENNVSQLTLFPVNFLAYFKSNIQLC